MKQEETSDKIRFPSFEALGDTSATAGETRRIWRQLFAGILLTGIIMAAMMPVALEQEVRGLQPGPIEDRLIQTAGWWREKMTGWNIDSPANSLRQYVENRSQVSWQESYCELRSLGIVGESSYFPKQLLESGQDSIECK